MNGKYTENCLLVGEEVVVIEEISKEEMKTWMNDFKSLEASKS